MPKISRLRLVTVGYKDARFHDLIVDLTHPQAGGADDSIVWLRNGGGKTSILNLVFSIPRPDLREFLGRKQEGKPRKLADYVLKTDIATIVIEWELEGQTNLLGKTRYLTGVLMERKSADPEDGTLKRLFFAGRSDPSKAGTTLETVPLWMERPDGKPARRTQALFREAWNDLRDAHPSLGLAVAETQVEWEGILEQANIDPELYSYQVRMNQKEGGADELFRFNTHEEFIDFLLGIAFDTETADKTVRNIATFRRELKQRNLEWVPDLELSKGLKDRIAPLVKIAEERATLRNRTWTVERDLSHLLDHANTKVARATTSHTKAADALRVAEDAHREAKEDHASAQKQAALIDRHLAQLRIQRADKEVRDRDTEAKAALRKRRLWSAAVPLAKARVHEKTRKDMLNDLARRKAENAPLLDELGETAANLRHTLKHNVDQIDTWLKTTAQTRDTHRATASAARELLIKLEGEDARLLSEATAIERDLAKAKREREKLERVGHLFAGESGSDAQQRLLSVLADLATQRDNGRKRQVALRAEWPNLREQILEQGRLHDAAKGEYDRITSELRQHAELKRRIENDALLLGALQVEVANLDTMLEAARHGVERDHRRTIELILRKRLERAEDERAIPNLEKHELLPPTRDVAELLDRLERRFTGVWSGWHYLAKNRKGAEEVRAAVRAAPEFALGIVVNDKDYEAATKLLQEGPAPEYPVAIFRESDFPNHPQSAAVVGPASDALFDTNAGRHEKEQRANRLAESASTISELEAIESAYRELADALRRYAKQYSSTWFEDRSNKLTETHGAIQRHTAEKKRLEGVLAESESAVNGLETTLDSLSKRRDEVQPALHQVQVFIRDHELTERERRATLDENTQRRTAISTERDDTRTSAETNENAANELSNAMNAKEREAGALRHERAQVRWFELAQSEPRLGPLAELRPLYDHRVKAYEREFQESLVHQLAEIEQQNAANELRKFTNLLRDDVTEKDVNAELDKLPDLALVEGLATQALEEHSAASALHATAAAQVKPLKAALAAAEAECTRLAATVTMLERTLPEDIPSADQVLAALRARVAIRSDEIPSLDKTERDARDRLETARQELSTARSHVNTIQEIARSYNDVLRPITPARSENWAPPEDHDIDARLRAYLKELGTQREQTKDLDERRAETTGRLRTLASADKYRALNNKIAAAFLTIADPDLEAQSSDLHHKLETRIINLQDQIDSVENNRNSLIELTLSVADEAIDLVRQAANHSRMPDAVGAFAGIPFLKIHYHEPPTPEERRAKASQLVDDTVNAAELPNGISYAQSTTRKLTQNVRVEALFPDTAAPIHYIPIPQTVAKSGGERLTMAVVMFCLLVRLRGKQHARTTTPFLLDNPVGTANLVRFIQVQRAVAKATGVQLIYTTGVNDLEALRVFPNIVRLRNARRDKRTGQQHIEHDPEPIDGARVTFEEAV